MSRFLGSMFKRSRRFGISLLENNKEFSKGKKRTTAPGQHGAKKKGITGVILLQAIESRLDNLVFRAGFARTRAQARQFVSHGHFLVDGHKANIPSMQIKVGSKIELKPSLQNNSELKAATEAMTVAPWIKRDKFVATYSRYPERNEFAKEINEALIVEYYNR